MSESLQAEDPKTPTSPTELSEPERRQFAKKLGNYAVFASVATVSLMASKRSAASLGPSDGPPGSPGF